MIYKFNPILKSTIWGGDKIAAFKNIATDSEQIGESWEISGVKGDISVVSSGKDAGMTLQQIIERDGAKLLGHKNFERFGLEFPLLIKFIDAKEDLSIQVHPNDELAMKRHNSKGKTEMWYVVDATPTAHLKSGLKSAMTPESYVAAIEDNSICDKLQGYNVKAGDVFFLPAGRIHSIGAGCFIAEIQQTSDITYRIYDFNRVGVDGKPRQLHTELSKDAIDYTVLDDYRTDYKKPAEGLVTLVDCPYFNVGLAELSSNEQPLPDVDSFIIVIGIDGEIKIETAEGTAVVGKGETALISADSTDVKIKAAGANARALTAYIA